jgi:hypothetical protein
MAKSPPLFTKREGQDGPRRHSLCKKGFGETSESNSSCACQFFNRGMFVKIASSQPLWQRRYVRGFRSEQLSLFRRIYTDLARKWFKTMPQISCPTPVSVWDAITISISTINSFRKQRTHHQLLVADKHPNCFIGNLTVFSMVYNMCLVVLVLLVSYGMTEHKFNEYLFTYLQYLLPWEFAICVTRQYVHASDDLMSHPLFWIARCGASCVVPPQQTGVNCPNFP